MIRIRIVMLVSSSPLQKRRAYSKAHNFEKKLAQRSAEGSILQTGGTRREGKLSVSLNHPQSLARSPFS